MRSQEIRSVEEYEECLREIEVQLERLRLFRHRLVVAGAGTDNSTGSTAPAPPDVSPPRPNVGPDHEESDEIPSSKNEDGYMVGDLVKVSDRVFLFGRKRSKWPKGDRDGKTDEVVKVTKQSVWLRGGNGNDYLKRSHNVRLVRGVDGTRVVRLPNGELRNRW